MDNTTEKPCMKFLALLKRAGVSISNEHELCERLSEVQGWRYAFETLTLNGHWLGIRFQDCDAKVKDEDIHHAFTRFQFPKGLETAFTASLRSSY